MKAKTLSIISKIIAALFLLASFILTVIFKGIPNSDQVFGMIQIAIFIGTVFVPVDLSIIIKNIKGIGLDNPEKKD